ncbi:MAG TPA: cbb3-type cytochrome c oxidase subunit 3 [Rudaea sp.]|nr:cbb3-type cytochrome c oxidase subunit 3 [Rudaea sp.]
MIMGIVTALLIVLFAGMVGWAYSARRHADFRDASRLPLVEDHSEFGT